MSPSRATAHTHTHSSTHHQSDWFMCEVDFSGMGIRLRTDGGTGCLKSIGFKVI